MQLPEGSEGLESAASKEIDALLRTWGVEKVRLDEETSAKSSDDESSKGPGQMLVSTERSRIPGLKANFRASTPGSPGYTQRRGVSMLGFCASKPRVISGALDGGNIRDSTSSQAGEALPEIS